VLIIISLTVTNWLLYLLYYNTSAVPACILINILSYLAEQRYWQCSAIEVNFNVMRSINSRFTYLLAYLLDSDSLWKIVRYYGPWHSITECCVIILEGRMLGKKTRETRWMQVADDLMGNSIYTDLKKATEDRSVWWTLRRVCHKPSEWADHTERSRFGSVGKVVGRINEVNQRRARLVLGWVTVCMHVNHLGM